MCKRLIFLVLLTLFLAAPVRAQFQPWLDTGPVVPSGRLMEVPPEGFFPRQPRPERTPDYRQNLYQRPEPVRCTQVCQRDSYGRVTCHTTCR